ncbi:MAG TPA: M56 family metallopeptidase [Thermoanaerobaculia bacterium]|nr:M56 family metallopeptidase [Thermoanaerobaculia bacterium]
MISGIDWIILQLRDLWMLGIAVPLIAKATLILVITQLIIVASPTMAAARKHLLYTAALTSLLLLPLLSLSLPQWEIQAFPQRAADESQAIGIASGGGLSLAPEPLRNLAQARREGRSLTDAAISMLVTELAGVELIAPALRTSVPSARQPDGVKPVDTQKGSPLLTGPGLGTLLLIGWLTGSLILLLQLLIGTVKLVLVVAKSRPLQDDDSRLVLSQAAQRAGVENLPEMLVSSAVSVPIVWGIFRPVILLPREAAWWPAERLRVVLIHELAHVRRMDGIWLLASRFAAATYWFHPLVWFVEKASRRECERASDDLVINRGTRPSDYAGHLLSIAHSLPSTESFESVTLGMSRPSQLQGRLRSILRDGTERAELTPRSVAVALTAAILLVIPLAALQLSAASPTAESKKGEIITEPRTGDEITVTSEATEVIDETSGELEEVVAEVAEVAADFRFDFEGLANFFSGDHDGDQNGQREGGIHDREHAGREAYSRGSKLHGDEHYREAIAAFRQAYEFGYRPAYSAYNAACGYARSGETEQALAWLTTAIDKGFYGADHIAEDSDLKSIRSDRRFQALVAKAGDVKKQRSVARRVAGRDELAALEKSGSTDGKRWYRVGSRLLSLRDMNLAIGALKRAETLLGSRNENALYNLACAYAIANDRQNGLDYLERAIDAGFDSPDKLDEDSDLDNLRMNPRFAAIKGKARALSMTDSGYREAMASTVWTSRAEHYESFLRANPSNGRAWFNHGFALHAAGSHSKAIESFKQAIRNGYREPVATYNIACAYARSGQKDLAVDWLERSEKAGFELSHHIRRDDDLDGLRSEPRFRKMLERVVSEKNRSLLKRKIRLLVPSGGGTTEVEISKLF